MVKIVDGVLDDGRVAPVILGNDEDESIVGVDFLTPGAGVSWSYWDGSLICAGMFDSSNIGRFRSARSIKRGSAGRELALQA